MAVAMASRDARPGWMNLRTLFGFALFSISLALGWQLLEGSGGGIRFWAAAKDLPAGVPLRSGDLMAVTGDLAAAQAPLYLGVGADVVGAELTRPVAKGELLSAGSVAESDEGFEGQVITVPVTPEHAVGGDLAPGDLVDVYATFRSAGASARTVLVVRNAQILDLVGTSDLLHDGSTLAGLSLDVTGHEAARLAHAIRTGELDVVRVSGVGPAGPTLVTGDDL